MSSDELKSDWFSVEWRHLAALRAFALEGSFAGAARRLGYTQPAISQQIAALERRVGGNLIDRSKPGQVRLTEAGERLVRHSAAIASRLQSAHDDVQAAFEGHPASVRLGVIPSVGARVLPPLLRRFTDERVGVRVSLTESWSDKELLKGLRGGELDVAFALTPLEPGPFLARVVARDPYVLICSADFELVRRGGTVALADLANVPLLSLHRQHGIEALLRSHGVHPNIAFRSNDSQTVMALVAEGLGAAIVPRLIITRDDPRLVEIAVQEELPVREIALAWSDDREISTPAQAFIDAALRESKRRTRADTEIGSQVSDAGRRATWMLDQRREKSVVHRCELYQARVTNAQLRLRKSIEIHARSGLGRARLLQPRSVAHAVTELPLRLVAGRHDDATFDGVEPLDQPLVTQRSGELVHAGDRAGCGRPQPEVGRSIEDDKSSVADRHFASVYLL